MNENVKKAFEVIKNNQELTERIRGCKSPDEAYEVAASAVKGFTLEEFKEGIQENAKSREATVTELTDDDLEKVSGGELGDTDEWLSYVFLWMGM